MKWGLVSYSRVGGWQNHIATAADCVLLLIPDSSEDVAKPGFSGQGAYSFAWIEEMCWLLVRVEQEK